MPRAACVRVLGASAGSATSSPATPTSSPRCASRSRAPPTADEYGADLARRRSTGLARRRRRGRAAGALPPPPRCSSPRGTSRSPTRSRRSIGWPRRWPTSRARRSRHRLAAARADGAASPRDEVAATRLAIIGMGKAGARELNYVSDVDVIFVAEGDGDDRERPRRRDRHAARDADDARHPRARASSRALWEVDANLRPEGKDGALVRTLDSHLAYYDRWAKSWEFQALLKARPLAGDRDLGERYVEAVAPKVWSSASREGLRRVGAADARAGHRAHPARRARRAAQARPGRPARRRVHRPAAAARARPDRRRACASARPSTRSIALADQGYIGRVEAAEFAQDYRFLRLLEHRLQLTPAAAHPPHAAPTRTRCGCSRGPAGVASSAVDLTEQWQRTKLAVRAAARAAVLPSAALRGRRAARGGLALSQRAGRGAARGDRLPRPARRAAAHRGAHRRRLAPGDHPAQPAAGHAAVVRRRRRPRLRPARVPPAQRRPRRGRTGSCGCCATRRAPRSGSRSVLSGSRFVGDAPRAHPGGGRVARERRRARSHAPQAMLVEEAHATVARHEGDEDAAALALRTARRREILRLALARHPRTRHGRGARPRPRRRHDGACSAAMLATRAPLRRRHRVRASSRWGGTAERSSASAPTPTSCTSTARPALRRGGAAAGRADRARAQPAHRGPARAARPRHRPAARGQERRDRALARVVPRLLRALVAHLGGAGAAAVAARRRRRRAARRVREARRRRALPGVDRRGGRPRDQAHQGAGRERAAAAGGRPSPPPQARAAARSATSSGSCSCCSCSTVTACEGLRTTSTLRRPRRRRGRMGCVTSSDAAKLRDAWLLASRARSAMTLWTARRPPTCCPPTASSSRASRACSSTRRDRRRRLEEDYLRTTRLARAVFERLFYGAKSGPNVAR